jgi:hypothetical protein
MIDLKKLLVCGVALILAVGATGCDEEGECDEAGVCTDGGVGGEGGFGGEGGEGGGIDTVFSYVIIDDISGEIAANGTPGVDICGVRANCEGGDVSPIGAELGAGEEFICGEGSPPAGITCSTDRNEANAALNYGACDASSDPSDYVSLGGGGRLTLTFGRDLQGCTLSIQEASGSTSRDETAEVSVCADAAASECLTVGGAVVLGTVDEGANPATISVPVFE